jgi:hypothetical protein
LHKITVTDNKWSVDPEKPVFGPILAFIGATEGFAEGLWLVALLSLVDTEGNGDIRVPVAILGH